MKSSLNRQRVVALKNQLAAIAVRVGPRPSRWLDYLLAIAILTCGMGAIAPAEEVASTADQGVPEASVASMKAMQRRAASLKVQSGRMDARAKAELVEAALLRYSNPGGNAATTDGSIWAWGKTGRPVSLAAIFFEQLPSGERKWSCELLSLSDEPVKVQAVPGWTWTPASSEIRFLPVPDAPAVSDNAAERGRQMKELARRFTASETFHERRVDQLRLMIRALHRYEDADQELDDGAIYAFASGTNPEVLLLLEARRNGGGRASWHFGFARMGAAMCQARLDDKIVWECPAIQAWDRRHPYFSMFGRDAEVFGEPAASEAEKK